MRYAYRQHLLPHLRLCSLLLTCLILPASAQAGIDQRAGTFNYSLSAGMDQGLAQIALYLFELGRLEGGIYTSPDIETGIVGYKIRYFDNGRNETIDANDWISVRRYRIPSAPDTTKESGYYKKTYIEYIDIGLDGLDNQDYYFIDGRRFDLLKQDASTIRQYQLQIESGITALIQDAGRYQKIMAALGDGSETAIKKEEAFDDGSLPSKVALGVDLQYVFRPIIENDQPLPEEEMVREIRKQVGFIVSACLAYTDVNGYRFEDIRYQEPLLQRTYDPMEVNVLRLIIDALFDKDADGLITMKNIEDGYTRFGELHQELAANARSLKREIVMPNEKLIRLRKEYEAVHKKPFKWE